MQPPADPYRSSAGLATAASSSTACVAHDPACTPPGADDQAADQPPSRQAGVAHPAPFTPAEILQQAGAENFPVAPWFLPRTYRRHLTAVYGFARLVDDLGDEARGDRAALLDAFEADLIRVWDAEPETPLLRALQPTVRECGLSREPFLRLVEANRRDLTVHRYETYDGLRGYCALSADPVGHIVLEIFGVSTPSRIALSDRVCTALQIVEHCQDVGEDRRNGRVYLPQEDLRRFGVSDDDLTAAVAGPRLRAALAFEVDRAGALLDEGTPLVATLTGTARLAVAGFVAGGRAAIAAIRRADHEVLSATRSPRKRVVATETLGVLLRHRPARSGA